MATFKPVSDKEELERLFAQFLEDAEQDVANGEVRQEAEVAQQKASESAEAFQKNVLGAATTAPPVQGSASDKASLWNLRFKK